MERQAQLEAQLDDEKQRQQELEEYEAYTGTMQYIIDVAKSKLGLLFKDEIIFREEE